MSPLKNPNVHTIALGKLNEFIMNSTEEIQVETLSIINNLGTLPHTKNLVELVDKENRIYEAKGSTKDFWIRIFWFWDKVKGQNDQIVMTHAYLKKENKTDPNEIKIANKIRKKYLNSRLN